MGRIERTTICSSTISICGSIPEKKFISGTNTIRFKMLQDGTRIQLELYPTLQIDKVTMGSTTLKYERDDGTFYVDFPKTLQAGRTYSIDVHYSGNPPETGRFGCFTFKQDTAGHPWINTACEGRRRLHLVAEQRTVAR